MMEHRILGSLEVVHGGRQLPLGGTKQRAVLAILLLHRREVVSVDRLVDELWGETPPDTATKTVQVYVSRLRKALGEGVLLTRGGGYVVEIDDEQLDAGRFERLGARGPRGAGARRRRRRRGTCFAQALALWRGPPLADLAYEPFAQSEIARLEELRLAALEDRIEAELALGGTPRSSPSSRARAGPSRVRERLRGQLMLALYRSGRQTDALASYRDARRALVDELGLEPSRELQALERAILAQDPALDAPARRRAPAGGERRRRGAALVGLGGGLLLAAAVAAIAASGGDDAGTRQATANSLAVIDPESNEVVATVPTGVLPADVAAGAGHIWVANQADDTVTQVDPRRRAVVSTTSPGVTVAGLTVADRGVWIGDANRLRLVRLDPGFRSVVQSLRLAPGPEVQGGSGPNLVTAGYGSVWAGSSSSAVARVDPRTRKVESVPVGNSPSAIATGLGGVWVTDSVDNTVARIDPASANAVTGTTPVGRGPSAVATGGGAVWVANTQDDTVARLDPENATVTDTVRVGRRPTGVAVGEGAVWVANSLSGTVSRIDPRSGRVEATVEVGEAPQGVTVAYGLVWVSVQQRATPEGPAAQGAWTCRPPLGARGPRPHGPGARHRLPAPQRHLRAALQLPRSPVPGGRGVATGGCRRTACGVAPMGARTSSGCDRGSASRRRRTSP